MMEGHSCAQLSLPRDKEQDAIQAAINENPRNASKSPIDLAVEVGKFWKPGRTLRVSLRGGTPYVRSKVQLYAEVWSEYANIHFQFVEQEPADIRVSFVPNNSSWSHVGTDALMINGQEPTMNFGWFNDNTQDMEFSRTVIHEFGHAIGCIHEQSQPHADIHWNKEYVYQYYAPMGWDRDDVDRNVFFKFSPTAVESSDYDPLSIMQYPVPEGFTTDGFVVGWNTQLSEKDIQFIKTIYPRANAPFTLGKPKTDSLDKTVKVATAQPVQA